MKIDFTIEHLQIIDKAIQQIPYYLAAPLIEHINKELQIEKAIMDTPISPSEAQKLFDAQVDAHNMPSGASTPKDNFVGD
jgi:hypothetical protein